VVDSSLAKHPIGCLRHNMIGVVVTIYYMKREKHHVLMRSCECPSGRLLSLAISVTGSVQMLQLPIEHRPEAGIAKTVNFRVPVQIAFDNDRSVDRYRDIPAD